MNKVFKYVFIGFTSIVTFFFLFKDIYIVEWDIKEVKEFKKLEFFYKPKYDNYFKGDSLECDSVIKIIDPEYYERSNIFSERDNM